MKIRNKICWGLACFTVWVGVAAKADKPSMYGKNDNKDTVKTCYPRKQHCGRSDMGGRR